MTVAPAPAAFSMGRVISRLFGVLQRNFVTFLLLSVLLVGLPSAIVAFVQFSVTSPLMTAGSAADSSAVFDTVFSPLHVGLGLVAFLATVIGNAVLQGAVIHASVSDLSGGRPSFGECLGTGARYFFPLLCIGLIVAVGCFFGFLLLIVPGVILALTWFVAAPAEVIERKGIFGSLARSFELTRNHRFSILGLCVLYGIATWIAQTTVSGAVSASLGVGAAGLGGVPGQGFQNIILAQAIVGLLIGTLFASISSAGVASVYFELRHAKEGVGIDQLAALFD